MTRIRMRMRAKRCLRGVRIHHLLACQQAQQTVLFPSCFPIVKRP